MLFNSLEFVVLVLLTGILYYSNILRPFQVVILIVASFVFYGSHNPSLLLLLLFSVSVNAFTSWKVHFGNTAHARKWAFAGVATNLLVLAFFKYAGLFASSLPLPTSTAEFLSTIPLPIGISFFTFQGISLLIDTFNESEDDSETKNSLVAPDGRTHFLSTVFYISFFPQLVAGPIVKAHEFLPQIGVKRFANIDWDYCFQKLVLGYFLKMFVADNLKDYTFWIQYPFFLNLSSADLVLLLFGYSMQIFADFAGYSLIAIGVAGLFGYRLPKNFDFPYIAASFSEFWRRWHISLSTWLRDYLYFPLGGNRKGRVRTYFNLFVVMFLGGLWHGAAWSYAVWGTVHGLALAVERLLRNRFRLPEGTVSLWIQRIGVFCFVTFAWLLFKLPEFSHVVAYVEAIGTNLSKRPNIATAYYVLFFSFPVVAYHAHYLIDSPNLKKAIRPYLLGMMLFMLIFNSGSPGEFIYFQF